MNASKFQTNQSNMHLNSCTTYITQLNDLCDVELGTKLPEFYKIGSLSNEFTSATHVYTFNQFASHQSTTTTESSKLSVQMLDLECEFLVIHETSIYLICYHCHQTLTIVLIAMYYFQDSCCNIIMISYHPYSTTQR